MLTFRVLFQHCCYCGAMTFRSSHLCTACLNKLFESPGLNQFNVAKNFYCHGFNILSLGIYKNPIMTAWIKALKKGDNLNDYNFIAQEWLRHRHFYLKKNLSFPLYIVPSPSRVKTTKKDHAFCLAHALSQITGWELWDILDFTESDSDAQKKQKRSFRIKRQFKTKNPQNKKANNIIFIDDVVTTGSTANAAYRALSKPKNYEVWCIAFQPISS